ncbi:uncharacterized protein LOC131643645 [Vicia villosa]|uniref:uncharacterized protein LOC131631780 n=1 Tax=Vicia villosa TaxID=3911 RepID=UPI00273C212F|nr:uncharacterized protein LOC131631780 [Vicia villosa]XP_058769906.1 uncharacterized protein LOC131643645 [Vicia villosa]
MAKKRKSIATTLDEVDRTMYASFCSAANSLSQLHMHALNHQKLSFQAGQRHSLEKLYQWIWRQQEGGSRVATLDILNYIQNELDYFGEEQSVSPRAALPPATQVASSGFTVTPGSSCQTVVGQELGSEHCDNQPKSFEFPNALPSPVRRSLQHYQVGDGGNYLTGPSIGNGNQNTESSLFHQQSTAFSSNDSAMDMHSD